MKVIETKNYKEAFIQGYEPSSEEQWKELSNIAESIIKIFNENDLGVKGVKCWVQKKDQLQNIYDVFISRIDETGKDEITELVIDGSYGQSKNMLDKVHREAMMKLMYKNLEESEPPNSLDENF